MQERNFLANLWKNAFSIISSGGSEELNCNVIAAMCFGTGLTLRSFLSLRFSAPAATLGWMWAGVFLVQVILIGQVQVLERDSAESCGHLLPASE